MKQNILEALKRFKQAASDLNSYWSCAEFGDTIDLDSNYPFGDSFDELLPHILKWGEPEPPTEQEPEKPKTAVLDPDDVSMATSIIVVNFRSEIVKMVNNSDAKMYELVSTIACGFVREFGYIDSVEDGWNEPQKHGFPYNASGYEDAVFMYTEHALEEREKYFYLYGEHGQLTVSIKTGKVLAYKPQGDEQYHNIVKVDVEELNKFKPLSNGESLDIEDAGFWYANGDYEKPNENHRKGIIPEDEPNLTFEQFQSTAVGMTKQSFISAYAANPEEFDELCFVVICYANRFAIQKQPDGEYYTIIHNREVSSNKLEEVERELYEVFKYEI